MTTDLSLNAIRTSLTGRDPVLHDGPAAGRIAAVAVILRELEGETQVLLIRRAEREGDPWSGQMAFPGGHRDPGDADMLATARRETLEEVGLDLERHEFIARLDDHAAKLRGRFTGMLISPFVFALCSAPALRLNHEVAEVVWAPLARMARGEVDMDREFSHDGELVHYPAYRVDGHVVWGLTHRMLGAFFEVLARAKPGPA